MNGRILKNGGRQGHRSDGNARSPPREASAASNAGATAKIVLYPEPAGAVAAQC